MSRPWPLPKPETHSEFVARMLDEARERLTLARCLCPDGEAQEKIHLAWIRTIEAMEKLRGEKDGWEED